MKHFIHLLFATLLMASCTSGTKKQHTYIIQTDYGDIVVEIFPDKAPKTCAAFIKNVSNKIYDKSSFYRVIKSENVPPKFDNGLIQGGIYESDIESKKQLPFIEHESPKSTGIGHSEGTISMARLAPGTAQSEFFICIGNQPQFDSSRSGNPDGLGYAAFGRVVKGYSVAKRIHQQKSKADEFKSLIRIISIRKNEEN